MGIVAELIAEDAEGAGGVAEAAGNVGRGLLIDEEGTEGFVLALQRELGRKEEVLVARCRYLIRSAGLHIPMVLQKHETVNMFWGVRRWLRTNSKQQRHKPHIVAGRS